VYSQADSLYWQGHKTFVIDSITIRGNDITDNDIVFREITFKVKDTVTAPILRYNRDRIYSLGIFTTVHLIPEETNGINVLVINVKESWYIWPVPFAELKDRSWKKISYGFDLNIKNFRGRNEQVKTRFGFGYDPGVVLMYNIPMFLNNPDVSLKFDFYYGNYKNNSDIAEYKYGEEFKQKSSYFAVTLGKRSGLYNYLYVVGGFQFIETPRYVPGVSASGGRVDRIFTAGVNYMYDSRDLAQFPDDGAFLSTSYSLKGFGLYNINYNYCDFDIREYKTILGRLSGKLRLYTGQVWGKTVPYFDYETLGLVERVRGHFNTKAEGSSMYLASTEIKYPLIKDWDLAFNFPIIPKSLQTYRVSLYTEAFYDAGTVVKRNDDLVLKNFMTGYGFGFTFLVLPYRLARVEIGIDKNGNKEWIFEIGTSF